MNSRMTVSLLVGTLVISVLAVGMTTPVLGTPTVVSNDAEPNDDRESATALDAGDPVNGTLESSGDVDWYAVEVTAGDGVIATLTLLSESANQSVEIDIYDPEGNEVGHTQSDGMGGPFNVAGYTSVSGYRSAAEIAAVAEANATYYVRVNRTQYENTEPGDIRYRLGVETADLDRYDPNENRAQATTITPGETIEAVMVGYDQDVYALTVPAGENVTVTVDSLRGGPYDFWVDLIVRSSESSESVHPSNGDFVYWQEYAFGSEFTFTAERGGTYYLTLVQGGDNTALLQTEDYALTVETSPGNGGTDDRNGC